MRLGALGTAAAAALVLALPAAASANPWQVRPGAGTCGGSDTQCGTIQQADDAAQANHVIEVFPVAGGWAGDVEFNQAGLTVRRGADRGEVRINGTLSFVGSGTDAQTFNIQGLTIISNSGPAVRASNSGVVGDKTVNLQSSILSGGGGSAAIVATTESFSLNPITIVARHVTVADSGGAAAYQETESGDPIGATFHDSIVRGSAPGATQVNPHPDESDGTLFVNASGEDYHVRVGSQAIDTGGTQQPGEWPTDVDGQDRGVWDRGGDEFVNTRPSSPRLDASNANPTTGETVTFQASGATDPDSSFGDGVAGYVWNFGDGTPTETRRDANAHFHSHAYGAAGQYTVSVQALDRNNATSEPPTTITVTVTTPPPGGGNPNTPVGPGGLGLPGIDPNAAPAGPDTVAPLVAIDFPAHNQAVKLARGPRTRTRTPMLRGGNADDSGVRRVELALVRRAGARCLWYDGRARFVPGSCTGVRWFRGTVDDYSWRHVFPRGFRPPLGAYGLLVRAFDYVGNASSNFSAPARTAVSFRYVR